MRKGQTDILVVIMEVLVAFVVLWFLGPVLYQLAEPNQFGIQVFRWIFPSPNHTFGDFIKVVIWMIFIVGATFGLSRGSGR